METNERNHSIKLPGAVEVFANLKNAQKFAIDIGMYYVIQNYYKKFDALD